MPVTEEDLIQLRRNVVSGRIPRSIQMTSSKSPSTAVAKTPYRMNKLEAAYAGILDAEKRLGIITWFGFEAVKLRLANSTHFTPDFAVVLPDGRMEFREVKGFWRDDARVKIKLAAELLPFRFCAVTRERGTGRWEMEVFIGAVDSLMLYGSKW